MIPRAIAAVLVAAAAAVPFVASAASGDASCVDLPRDLRLGDRDAETVGAVSALQRFLWSEGFLGTEPSGYFGPLTERGVTDFQEARYLEPATGVVGSTTRTAIRRRTCWRGAASVSFDGASAVSLRAAPVAALSADQTVASSVKFDLSPLPERRAVSPAAESVTMPRQIKIGLKTEVTPGDDGKASLVVRAASARANATVASWEFNISCGRGAAAFEAGHVFGSVNRCGDTIVRYGYELTDPEDGFALLEAALENSRDTRATVRLRLLAFDADGNRIGRAQKSVRVAPGTGTAGQ